MKKYFWQLPLLRVLKIKRCFQKVQCLYVVKLKFGQLQPTFLNLSSNFMKLLWVKGFHILLNTILQRCKQQVNLFVLKKITSKYLGIKSTTQKYKNTATILLTVWKSHGMHYGEYAVHCFLTIHMELETLVCSRELLCGEKIKILVNTHLAQCIMKLIYYPGNTFRVETALLLEFKFFPH